MFSSVSPDLPEPFWSYPQIDPVALDIGVFQLHWYGLMYLFGFAFFWLFGRFLAGRHPFWTRQHVDDFLFYGAIGVMLGGRLGYILFYDLAHYLEQPLDVLKVWQGGMSFHGGMLGVMVAMLWFARYRMRVSPLAVSDFVVVLVPMGLFFGRVGNFINGELWGAITQSPLGMRLFDPQLNEWVLRYPTQLLEALLEGLVLFAILLVYHFRRPPLGAVSGAFLIGYGAFRFLVEFWRVPDPQLGYLAWGWVTMGQVLSLPMILAGLGLLLWSYRNGIHKDG
ncbi:prolipoprotein diacylglyceryl transferase [Hydrogenovibrio halophilus]|uniref:prolipoprotein diacylglyceryl transferase n=1 Tax=Hydrogenovibrio halophilus TaxID=373391 RepID=UPI00039D0C1F|nr:prolipoprotein diacylglyceryl transferase [Hydrogenovibrio halophilus]